MHGRQDAKYRKMGLLYWWMLHFLYRHSVCLPGSHHAVSFIFFLFRPYTILFADSIMVQTQSTLNSWPIRVRRSLAYQRARDGCRIKLALSNF